MIYFENNIFNNGKDYDMKRIVSLLGVLVLVLIAITGCSKAVDEKLCRIEISDSNYNIITVLENQSQSDVSKFFDESNWKETENSTDNLVSEYVITVYQEKTETVIKADDNDEYIKIMEYVTFENSDIVKVLVGGDVVKGIVSDKFLEEYYIASSDFFLEINNAVSKKVA